MLLTICCVLHAHLFNVRYYKHALIIYLVLIIITIITTIIIIIIIVLITKII